MPKLILTPASAISASATAITEIEIADIRVIPAQSEIHITVYAGKRSHRVTINNANADPDATPPVIGDYDATIALIDVAALTAALQGTIESAIAD